LNLIFPTAFERIKKSNFELTNNVLLLPNNLNNLKTKSFKQNKMKSTKNLSVFLIAIAIGTASCVDNVVSPQVEAIRTQQVEWMKAKTATEVALAAMNTAAVKFKLSNDSLILKLNESNNNLLIANNVALLKKAEADLAIQDLALKNALNTLAIAVAKSGDDLAQEYYANYAAQATALSTLNASRLTTQGSLAVENLLLASNTLGGSLFLDNFKNAQQVLIDKDNVTLLAQKAALASLNSVVADPASVQTEINSLTKTNSDLNISKDKLNLDLAKANNAVSVATKIYDDGQDVISKMATLKIDLRLVSLDIISQDKAIADAEVDLSDANTMLIAKKTNLVNAKAIYTQEKANYDGKLSTFDTATDVYNASLVDFNFKNAATIIAYENWDKVTADANKTKWQAAKLLSDAALLVKNTALTDLNTATTALNTAFTPYNAAKTAVNSAESAVVTAENDVTSADKDLLNEKNDNIANALEKTSLEKAIADLNASFTTESSKQFQYALDVDAANDVVTALNKQITAITTSVTQNNSVITSLNTSKSNIDALKSSITTKMADIATTEKSIAENTSLLTLSSAANAKIATEAKILKLNKDLDAVNVEITAVEKLAAYWKALLDKAFTI